MRVGVVRRELAVLERAQARAGAGRVLAVGLLHRLDDVLAHDRAGVEVAQLEVGVLRAELVAQLVAGGVGEVARLADSWPACLASSGSLSGPNTSTATNAMTASSGRPTPNTGQNLLVGVSPSCMPARPRPRPESCRRPRSARRRAGAVGSASTIGLPASPPSRSEVSSGIRPSTGTS